ncbi:MAG: stage II sporulation protein M [Candidatus Pacearchaeota archaeon]
MIKKKTKKSFGIKENFFSSWKFIKKCKNFIYISILIFLLFAFFGFFVPAPEEISQKIFEFIEELLRRTEGLSQIGLIAYIFFNNLQSSFFGMFFGVFLGIFPIINAILNGYLVGFVASLAVEQEGIWILWRLVPHGVFELPAIFISLGLGLRIGVLSISWFIIKPIKFYWKENKLILLLFILFYLPALIVNLILDKKFRKSMKKNYPDFKNNLKKAILAFAFVVLPLLIIAAIIEGILIYFF